MVAVYLVLNQFEKKVAVKKSAYLNNYRILIERYVALMNKSKYQKFGYEWKYKDKLGNR